SRLVAMVEESVTTLVRTAFSASVRESNDLTCALMDAEGAALAQSLVSTPLHTAVKSETMRALLRKYPLAAWQPGDAAISNDPWEGTGHRNDVTIARPIFHRGRAVGFAVNDTHWQDIGGAGMQVSNRDVYEEGLGIPDCKILRAGRPVEEVFEFIRLNTRLPEETLGDLNAQLVAAQRLADTVQGLLAESGLDDLSELGAAIYDRSERAMRAAIGQLRPGTYRYGLDADGIDAPIHLQAAVTVPAAADRVIVDFSGSSPETRHALNAVRNYTYAWTVFALKAALDPETPSNDGSLRPFDVQVPEGSVLNPRWGAPVSVRHQTGHYIPTVVLSALAEAAPDRVIAECGAPPHRSVISGSHYAFTINAAGGLGAGLHNDGLSATAFPTNTVCIPLEMLERLYPVLFWRRELIADSGGPGAHRGGLGQRIDFEFTGAEPARLLPLLERTRTPAAGRAGGLPGATAGMTRNGQVLPPKVLTEMRAGDRFVIRTAGGGGFGDPAGRDRDLLTEDVDNGRVTREAAARAYGVRP
ncbi:MAG TPA: hydantoinase B/oxoprolinase family protein, partial [Bacillota bacterium]|nr:hydantoinase B/oxoprolinase family protein [Bacillota bacterium]